MPDSPEHSQATILVHISQDLEPIVPGFLANRRRDLVTIEACLKQSDFNTIRMLGHRMKGDGGGYGFDHISAIGDRLEQAAIAQNPAAVTAQVADLKDFLAKVTVIYTP
ncbi:MAG TPA: Hpt domain-containing protein [Nitrospira sp.]|jgi:HPt (histidine-containing phosphotransfer) domain-containing protein|nr:Hpt domain-containing protein [Nitrospira sp.]HNN42475.1 Hpt domain-containing protein [Nitrospira sp.]HNO34719.1 Hpt domain-containing protein [Nitrospira sp.]